MTRIALATLAVLISLAPGFCGAAANDREPRLPYLVTDTGQDRCFANGREIAYPSPGKAYHGQDAQYVVTPPRGHRSRVPAERDRELVLDVDDTHRERLRVRRLLRAGLLRVGARRREADQRPRGRRRPERPEGGRSRPMVEGPRAAGGRDPDPESRALRERRRRDRPDEGTGKGPKTGKGRKQRAHATCEEVARMAAGAKAKKLVLVHFRAGAIDEEATRKLMRPIYSGEIVFARDLETHRR